MTTGRLLSNEGDMSTTTRIVLDAFNQMRSRTVANKVDRSYPPLGTTATMSHGNSSRHVSTTLGLALLGKGQWQKGPSFPEMIVNRSLQMSHTRGSGLVGSHNGGLAARSVIGEGRRIARAGGRLLSCSLADGRI